MNVSSTALIVVDMQNDFADPHGSLYVRGAEQIFTPLNAAIERARSIGALVVYTQDWHPPSTPHFKKDGGIWPVHCVQNSWGAQLHESILQVPGEIVRKGIGGEDGYSAFSFRDPVSGKIGETGLEKLLRARGVSELVVGGLAMDYCVKETALDALRKGFGTTVLVDATRPVELQPGDGKRALDELRRHGARLATVDVELLADALTSPPLA
jgi:nicotinamidase/pyrazinamidase